MPFLSVSHDGDRLVSGYFLRPWIEMDSVNVAINEVCAFIGIELGPLMLLPVDKEYASLWQENYMVVSVVEVHTKALYAREIHWLLEPFPLEFILPSINIIPLPSFREIIQLDAPLPFVHDRSFFPLMGSQTTPL